VLLVRNSGTLGTLVIARAAGDAQIGKDVLAASRARLSQEIRDIAAL